MNNFKARYIEGEVLAIQDYDVTGNELIGVFKVLRSFDVQKVLVKYQERWPEPTTVTKFVEFLITHSVLEVIKCTEVLLDSSSHVLIDTKEII